MELELQQRPSTFPNITWAMLLGPHFLSSHLLLHSPWLGEPHPIVRTEGSVGSSLYCYALGTPPTCQNSSLFRGFDPSRPRLLNQRISSSKDYLNKPWAWVLRPAATGRRRMAYASSLGRPWTPTPRTPRARRMTGWVELRNGLGPAQEIFPAYLDKDTKAEGLWGHRPLSGHPFHHVCPGGQFLAHPPNAGRYSPELQSETVASYYSATRFKKPDREPLPQQTTSTGHGRYSGWCDNDS
eukprot:s706_g1.t1